MPALHCPSCRTPLTALAPGPARCPGCQRALTIPDPSALLAKQRSDRLLVALLVGLPLLAILGICGFFFVVYTIAFVVGFIGGATS